MTGTRTGSGRMRGARAGAAPPPAREPVFQLAAEDLAPVKARILLMLALTKTKDATRSSGCSRNTERATFTTF